MLYIAFFNSEAITAIMNSGSDKRTRDANEVALPEEPKPKERAVRTLEAQNIQSCHLEEHYRGEEELEPSRAMNGRNP